MLAEKVHPVAENIAKKRHASHFSFMSKVPVYEMSGYSRRTIIVELIQGSSADGRSVCGNRGLEWAT